MGCNTSRRQIAEPTSLPVKQVTQKPQEPQRRKVSHQPSASEKTHSTKVDLVTDLFQYYPALLYYKLVESQLDLIVDVVFRVSQIDRAKYGEVLKEPAQ